MGGRWKHLLECIPVLKHVHNCAFTVALSGVDVFTTPLEPTSQSQFPRLLTFKNTNQDTHKFTCTTNPKLTPHKQTLSVWNVGDCFVCVLSCSFSPMCISMLIFWNLHLYTWHLYWPWHIIIENLGLSLYSYVSLFTILLLMPAA